MLEWLDKAELAIKVAGWFYLEDYEDWRFALASPRLDAAGGLPAYGLVSDALKAAGLPIAKRPTLLIFGMKERFLKGLRTQFPKIEDPEGVKIHGERIGDRWVEDGVLYRVR
jgi:hypothetical protein